MSVSRGPDSSHMQGKGQLALDTIKLTPSDESFAKDENTLSGSSLVFSHAQLILKEKVLQLTACGH